mmetsp:Transcript_19793/g.28709  ORF Transcript_19793/g.28709 Transcript_19793/m.28709 type:complete len:157 (+) Transcript_19793:190-660(+)
MATSAASAAAAAASLTTAHSTKSTVLSTYRTLHKLIRNLPPTQQHNALTQLRTTYKSNVTAPTSSIQPLIEEAGKKIAYLRIVTPKDRSTNQKSSERWIYDGNGNKVCNGSGQLNRDGKAVSNWNGKNLDPCSVKRHRQQLGRAGFVNNLHAKGLF